MVSTAVECGMIIHGKEQRLPMPADRVNEDDVDQ